MAAGDGSRVAAALLKQGDAAIASDPQRAATLYARAEEAGADPTTVGIRKAETAWAIGDIDRAGSLLDALDVDESSPVREKAVDLAAAVWAARGSMEMSRAVYISASQPDRPAEVHALIANVAAGYRERDEPAPSPPPAGTIPSTLQVSTHLLSRGLRETLSGTPASSIDDLVRATETYTASRCIAPIPELPAVIAALTAINLGELDIAESLLRDAIAGGHGGRWARNRLLLWSGWVAVRQGLPDAARGFLHSARSSTQTLSPRDHHLADAIDVALARRNGDVQALRAALDRARKSVLHTEFDLFSLLPLAELVIAAAQLGSGLLVHRRFEDALARMRGMGSPPLWSAQLYWAGVLQGVHEDRPAELKRHLEALLTAAPHSRLAAHTAQAGQSWVALLAGDVDVDAVERSARGLASVGLGWDGADLAGYAAARIDDRKAISRLLGCARELQQREHFLETPDPGQRAEPQDPARSAPLLSAREREVAVLVLAGKTYVEIGAAMFISPRTAEHHIARIRRRVGAASRSDLIAKLRLMFEGEDDEGNEGEPDSSAPPRRESA
ncbi:MAG TPA: LuxR C-terminal-related transcriptional regulator [Microbacterium sp.]|nr:LuxR C-terminal-related transcriptional regulator [Microbacterium sp.]